jgi:hypothetical protein
VFKGWSVGPDENPRLAAGGQQGRYDQLVGRPGDAYTYRLRCRVDESGEQVVVYATDLVVTLQPRENMRENGIFDLECQYIGNQGRPGSRTIDPIKYPGDTDTSHMHDFFGFLDVDENSSFTTMQEALNAELAKPLPEQGTDEPYDPPRAKRNLERVTNCTERTSVEDGPPEEIADQASQPGGYVDRDGRGGGDPGEWAPNPGTAGAGSAYWAPSLYVDVAADGYGVYQHAPPDRVHVYYRSDSTSVSVAFPPQFSMITPIFESERNAKNGGRFAWFCTSLGNARKTFIPNDPGNDGGGDADCKGKGGLNAAVSFQPCWDGERTGQYDSVASPRYGTGPDHNDHISYGSKHGNCPASHPYKLLRILAVFTYPIERSVNPELNGRHIEQGDRFKISAELMLEGTLTAGSAVVTDVDATRWDCSGYPCADTGRTAVAGDGLPAGAVVETIEGPTRLRLSEPATSSGTASLRFSPVWLLHADYLFSWRQTRLDFLTHQCGNREEDCKNGAPPTPY